MDGSIVHLRMHSEEQDRKQTPEKEEPRRASRLSYIRFPRRAWTERRSFQSTSGGTAAVAEAVTPASSNSSVSGLRTAFSGMIIDIALFVVIAENQPSSSYTTDYTTFEDYQPISRRSKSLKLRKTTAVPILRALLYALGFWLHTSQPSIR